MFKLNSSYINKKYALEDMLARIESEIRNNTPADVNILDWLDTDISIDDNIINIAQDAADICYYWEAMEALKKLDWDCVADKIKNCGVSLFQAIQWQTQEDVETILWDWEDRLKEALDVLALPCSVIIDEDTDAAERVSVLTEAHESYLMDRPILEDLDNFMDCLDEEDQLEVVKAIIADFDKIVEEAEKIEDCSGEMGFAGAFRLALEEYCSACGFVISLVESEDWA